MKITSSLKPLRQRMTELQDGLQKVQSQLKAQAGVPILELATCGHPECGAPPPQHLPTDCFVVYLGCRYRCPEQLDQAALDQEEAAPSETPSPSQEAAFQKLLAVARNEQPTSRLLTR